MNKIKIYCIENSEQAEYESLNRGYRNDIYVEINNNFYNIVVYDIIRLQQDFESEMETYSFFAIDPNVIIVKDVLKENIIFTIKKLLNYKYFEKIKPVLVEDINMNALIEM